jgi:catechol-2,3-dioxygenase
LFDKGWQDGSYSTAFLGLPQVIKPMVCIVASSALACIAGTSWTQFVVTQKDRIILVLWAIFFRVRDAMLKAEGAEAYACSPERYFWRSQGLIYRWKAEKEASMFQIEALDHVALHVQDVQQSIDWYQSVLGMEQRTRYRNTTGLGNPVEMRVGDVGITLFPSSPGQPVQHIDGHIAMRLTRANFEQAQAHLRQLGIDFQFVHYARCDGIYFNDPNGYQIELSTWFL